MAKKDPFKITEKSIHIAVCDYLRAQYPHVIFTSDSSGARVSMGLRIEFEKKRCACYKVPDILILHPTTKHFGLILEVKKSIKDVYKKDGSFLKSEHLQAQWESILRLRDLGYSSDFGCGFVHCCDLIDKYMALA